MNKLERVDNTGFGGYRLIQGSGFRYGVDAVLLAAFANGETGAAGIAGGTKDGTARCRRAGSGVRERSAVAKGRVNVADLGCGSGIVPLILAHKCPESFITGFELQEEEADRALRTVKLNGLQDRIRIIRGDVAEIPSGSMIRGGEMDAVVTNPPYFRSGSAIPNREDGKYFARHETSADVRAFLRAAAWLLKPRGNFYMVHRPARLADIIVSMRNAGIEPKTLQYVVPKPGMAANLILVHGIRGAGAELRMLPEIAVRDPDGNSSEVLKRLYERNRES